MKTFEHEKIKLVISIEDGSVAIWSSEPEVAVSIFDWNLLSEDLDSEGLEEEERAYEKEIEGMTCVY